MVNSKKMSKSTIAVILLSLLLCLSLVLTATGAWFTDKADGEGDTLTFGEIDIEVTEDTYTSTGTGYLTDVDIMPGDTVNASVKVNNVKEAVYIRVTVTATDDVTSSALTLSDVEGMEWNETDSCYYGSIAQAAEHTISFSVVLNGDDYGNEYQGQTITFAVKVEAIQQANLASASAAFAEITGEVPAKA